MHSTTLAPQVFGFKGNDVRVILAEDGEPRWVAADVSKVLGLGRTHDMVRTLDEDERGTDTIRTPSGQQEMTTINESGLYSAILRSRKPEAKQFKKWVTGEVLPAIRKHGAYMTEQTIEKVLTDPDTIIKLATDLKEERAKRAELERQRQADAPKVIFADAVSASKSSILVGELAKILKGNGVDIGATRLFALLREEGYLIRRKGSDWNMPTQRSMELELFEIKETAITHSDGHVSISKTSKVTGKGQQYFIERFMDGRLGGKQAA